MTQFYAPETPDRVKNATKGLHLITALTPNGRKAHIYLEELKETYGLPFTISLIDLDTNEQKKPWFLRLNPNGRIPLLIDNTTTPHPHVVMESSAILLYLFHQVDHSQQFGFADPLQQSQLLQWLVFWGASGQMVQGQWNYFRRNQVENDHAKKRFHDELLRVYHVLEAHLAGRYTDPGLGREYLADQGKGKYTLADINAWPWVRSFRAVGLEEEELDRLPALAAWVDRVGGRAAVQRGAFGEAYDEGLSPELVIRT
ncbi:glutathione S-transferase family protein [Aspergillus brunneoviolaceus CBS 621.78]|uniref:Glutathione S-transferase n=1 Tax=Aspergillus brunneoviolaceus CBS 621.78 TaxID=1450534 RepID=A0ACD1FS46_9EURO|nr:glutathione S-transferase [Aspergillus brunneoviolaceus CBS 621.78]RAH39798.1 glutathione S-transferase [Aspergillus brunneoviolaceus CBS 621.78]